MSKWKKKRKLEQRKVYGGFQSNRPKRANEKFKIIGRVKSQKGFRSQVVFIHGVLNIEPLAELNSALQRVNATMNVKNIGLDADKQLHRFGLYINNELIVADSYTKEYVARRELAKLAVDELKKTCFTILKKIRPRDSPAVSVASKASTSTDAPLQVGGIGAKMLAKMGWSGGGLGAKEQGRTDIVKVTNQIDRRGLGMEDTLPVEEIKKILHDYAVSDNINSISFSPDFTKEERATIHSVAKRMNLKSSSYGGKNDRRLVVQKKINPWQLIQLLLEVGGENEQYQLILPSKFVK